LTTAETAGRKRPAIIPVAADLMKSARLALFWCNTRFAQLRRLFEVLPLCLRFCPRIKCHPSANLRGPAGILHWRRIKKNPPHSVIPAQAYAARRGSRDSWKEVMHKIPAYEAV